MESSVKESTPFGQLNTTDTVRAHNLTILDLVNRQFDSSSWESANFPTSLTSLGDKDQKFGLIWRVIYFWSHLKDKDRKLSGHNFKLQRRRHWWNLLHPAWSPVDHNHPLQHFKLRGRRQTSGNRFRSVLGCVLFTRLGNHWTVESNGVPNSNGRYWGFEISQHGTVGSSEFMFNINWFCWSHSKRCTYHGLHRDNTALKQAAWGRTIGKHACFS